VTLFSGLLRPYCTHLIGLVLKAYGLTYFAGRLVTKDQGFICNSFLPLVPYFGSSGGNSGNLGSQKGNSIINNRRTNQGQKVKGEGGLLLK
jgi:hypothetical protein